jgi:thymidylate kinase
MSLMTGSRARRAQPGGVVVVVGPDGAGKTTLRHALANSSYGLDLKTERRPGPLPKLDRGIVTEPHRHPPRSTLASSAKLVYYFTDAWLVWLFRVRPQVREGTWVVKERGWWDMIVDPRRYRLRTSPGLVRALGRLLPRPDLLVILEAPPDLIRSRKTELPAEEIQRQMQIWREAVSAGQRQRRLYLDASLPVDELVRLTSEEVRRMGGAPGGWTGLPSRSDPRWTLPRGPRTLAAKALRIYQPVTLKGLAGWSAARVVASVGGFRLLPGSDVEPSVVASALEPRLGPLRIVALAKTNHPGRFVALLADDHGRCRTVAKFATDEAGRAVLRREGEAIEALGALLPPPLFPPRIQERGEGHLILDAVEWQPRLLSWRLPEEVANALGRFFAAGVQESSGGERSPLGPAHGDFAPWNLFRTRDGWTLLDWEEARQEAPPFFDLFHYLVQAHALLRHPTRRQLLAGIEGTGRVGRAIHAYASGAGLRSDEAMEFFRIYLEESSRLIQQGTPAASRGVQVRLSLLDEVKRRRGGP